MDEYREYLMDCSRHALIGLIRVERGGTRRQQLPETGTPAQLNLSQCKKYFSEEFLIATFISNPRFRQK
jgi:hypothetical protein